MGIFKSILIRMWHVRWLQIVATSKIFMPLFRKLFVTYDLTDREIKNALKYGIGMDSYIVYDFDKWDITQYLSNREMTKLGLRSRGVAPMLADKRNLPLLLQNCAHFLPSLNIAIENGRVQYIIEDGKYREGLFDLTKLLDEGIKKHKELILKPNDLYGGSGIITTDKISIDDIKKWIGKEKNAVINNILTNEEYIRKINPYSLNTIRINFFKTKNGTLKILSMLHRFGTSSESRVDNISMGGGGAGINPETGELQQAYILRKKRINIETHPVTGEQITGLIIPEWNDKKKQIEELLKEINYLEYGGLDVAFTTEGLKIIEINARYPHLRSMQFSFPALIDEEFVEFLRLRGFER